MPSGDKFALTIRFSTIRVSTLVLCCFLWQALSGQVGAHPWHLSESGDGSGHHLHLLVGDVGLTESSNQQDNAELCLECHCHSGQATLPWLQRVSVVAAAYEPSHYRLWYYPLLAAVHLRPPISFS